MFNLSAGLRCNSSLEMMNTYNMTAFRVQSCMFLIHLAIRLRYIVTSSPVDIPQQLLQTDNESDIDARHTLLTDSVLYYSWCQRFSP